MIPALDLKGGRCVRLKQGDPELQTVYGDEPLEVAIRWEQEGASRLHVVDLDGAFQGNTTHQNVIESIASNLNIPIQVGGGLRTREAVADTIKLGADRVILGTVAAENPDFLKELLAAFGEKIIVGVDAREGKVAVRGWKEEVVERVEELVKRLEKIGVKEIIYTDIMKDGTLEGPNFSALKNLAQDTSLSIIVSGGISRLEDILEIKKMAPWGVSGAIIGKALYTGKIDFKEALAAVRAH